MAEYFIRWAVPPTGDAPDIKDISQLTGDAREHAYQHNLQAAIKAAQEPKRTYETPEWLLDDMFNFDAEIVEECRTAPLIIVRAEGTGAMMIESFAERGAFVAMKTRSLELFEKRA